MKNWKIFFHSLVFIVLISGIGGFIGGKAEQNSNTYYQAFLPFKLKSEHSGKEIIDNLRYFLLYESNTIKQLTKDFKLSRSVVAANLKILMENDQTHFSVIFKFRDKKVAQKIIQQVSKIIQKKQPDIKQNGIVIVQRLAKQNAKIKLIGSVVGFFFSVGITAVLFYTKKK
ncbi:MAG: hypothetical protein LBS28_00170 [Streptococcaceae bacterium]|jgi:hypothetical protein|nr:hypothetical protein [Streptococcaceae bacterium]